MVMISTNFGDVVKGWCLVDISDVAFFQEGPGLRKWQWTEVGMKVINVKNINWNGTVDTSTTSRYISLEEFEERYRHFAIEGNDVLVAGSGNTYGKTGKIKPSQLPVMMNTSVIRFHSLDNEVLDSEYLYAFLRSHLFKGQVEAQVTGSAQPNF